MAKEQNNLNEPIVDVSEAVNKTDELFEKNKKQLTVVALGIAAIVAGYFIYNTYVVEPREMEADSKIWIAENNFKNDSLDLAVNGQGLMVPGFEKIANEYSGTESGNLAEYYSGIAELKRGNFEKAIDHLERFSTENELLRSVATGAIGDAYLELGDSDKASTYYRRAASFKNNKLTTPFYLYKLGLILEDQNELEDALDVYKSIKRDYASSEFSKNIDKYIARVNQKLGN